jgi:hypothetical protein
MILLYIDPGSGTLIWQALVAAVLGAIFYFRSVIASLMARVRIWPRGKPDGNQPGERDQ